MVSFVALVRDIKPGSDTPDLEIQLPQEIGEHCGWAHRDRLALDLGEDGIWEATVGIKPSNPPYLHRPLRQEGRRMSLGYWLREQDLGNKAQVLMDLVDCYRLRWREVQYAGQHRAGLQPTSNTQFAAPRQGSPDTISKESRSENREPPSDFPLRDPQQVKALAQNDYWALISEREAQAERFLGSWLPSYRKKGELDKPMFVQLARWKSTRQTPRYEANSEEQVRTQTRIAFEAKEDDRALASLMELSGVGMRTATALLHWMRPESFPILDFRVVNALGEPQPANWENLAEYGRLAKRLRGLAGDLGVDMRTLDRALWAWDKRRS